MSVTAKDYFRHFLADDVLRQLNHDLVDEILKYKPRSVFEFGCGQGKNLELLLEMNPKINVWGGDISKIAVNEAIKKERYYVAQMDENSFDWFVDNVADASFTCSVLDHIEHEITVDHILTDLKRISRKAVILYETQRHTPSTFYYSHDYEDYGFKKLDYQYFSSEKDGGDNSYYGMFVWERPRKK